MTEIIFGKNFIEVYVDYLFDVWSANTEGAGFMTHTAASHQGTADLKP